MQARGAPCFASAGSGGRDSRPGRSPCSPCAPPRARRLRAPATPPPRRFASAGSGSPASPSRPTARCCSTTRISAGRGPAPAVLPLSTRRGAPRAHARARGPGAGARAGGLGAGGPQPLRPPGRRRVDRRPERRARPRLGDHGKHRAGLRAPERTLPARRARRGDRGRALRRARRRESPRARPARPRSLRRRGDRAPGGADPRGLVQDGGSPQLPGDAPRERTCPLHDEQRRPRSRRPRGPAGRGRPRRRAPRRQPRGATPTTPAISCARSARGS